MFAAWNLTNSLSVAWRFSSTPGPVLVRYPCRFDSTSWSLTWISSPWAKRVLTVRVCWQVSIPTMRLIELHVQTGTGMHVNITTDVPPCMHTCTHTLHRRIRENILLCSLFTHRHMKTFPLLAWTHTHTHTEPYTPDRLIVWGCMDAWIKLLVQESRASRLIKKRPCAAGLERKRARWRKRKHARAVWFCISLTKAGGREGWKSSISHAGLRGGSQCNHF